MNFVNKSSENEKQGKNRVFRERKCWWGKKMGFKRLENGRVGVSVKREKNK